MADLQLVPTADITSAEYLSTLKAETINEMDFVTLQTHFPENAWKNVSKKIKDTQDVALLREILVTRAENARKQFKPKAESQFASAIVGQHVLNALDTWLLELSTHADEYRVKYMDRIKVGQKPETISAKKPDTKIIVGYEEVTNEITKEIVQKPIVGKEKLSGLAGIRCLLTKCALHVPTMTQEQRAEAFATIVSIMQIEDELYTDGGEKAVYSASQRKQKMDVYRGSRDVYARVKTGK